MSKVKPCPRCGRPRPASWGHKTCGVCKPVDAIWERLVAGPGGCWLWPGRTHKGYARYGGALVHRLTYEALIGEIPIGLTLDHLCLVPTCANPWHLEPVTRAENTRRKWALYTHCKNGHEFTPENTYRDPRNGKRGCRICEAASARRYYARKSGVSHEGVGDLVGPE